ncbi:MAG: hypothetical protein AB7U76_24505, partial [Pirellulales bacterium]
MPFDDEAPPSPVLQQAFKGQTMGSAPGFWQRLGDQAESAFSRENMIGSAFNYRPNPDAEIDPLRAAIFNPDDYLTDQEKVYGERFASANSPADIEHIRREIEREGVMRGSLRDGPLPEWLASTVAAVADPTTFLPVVGPLTRAGRAAGAFSGFVGVGLSTAAGVGVQEAFLQSTQRTRSAEESAGNMIGGLIFGGLLGTAAGAILGRTAAAPKGVGRKVLEDLSTEATQTLRAAGLGDMPIPRSGLLNTTAIGRFLDAPTTPKIDGIRKPVVALADNHILDAVNDANPKLVSRNAELMTTLDALEKRIEILEADPTLFVRGAQIRDRATLDLIEGLRKEGTPDAMARIAQIEEGAKPPVTLERLLTQRDELYEEWAANEARLTKLVEITKKKLGEIGQLLGEKEYANANDDIAKQFAAMKDALAKGKDPLKLKQESSLIDWLQGHAQYPGQRLQEAKTKEPVKPEEKAKEEQKLRDDEETKAALKDATAESASAAAVESTPAEVLSRMRSTLGMAKVSNMIRKFGLTAPAVELAMSRFETSRKMIQLLANSGMVTEGHWAGARGPDDFATEVKALGNPAVMQMQRIVEAAWAEQKKAVSQGAQALSRLEFYEQIGEAMTKGDTSPNPVAEKAAKLMRKIDDHFKDLAKEWKVGVFKNPEAAESKMGKTAQSHLLRRWHTIRMEADPEGFKALVKDWFLRTHAGEVNQVKDLADDVAEDVFNKIIGAPEGRMPPEIKVSEGRGSAKERTFMIPDNWTTLDGKYKTSDFTDRNVVNVMAQYIRTMSGDIAYQKIIGGDEGLKFYLSNLQSDRDAAIKAVGDKNAIDLAKKLGDADPDKAEKIMAEFDKRLGQQSQAIMADWRREANVLIELTHRIRGTDPHPPNAAYAGLKRVSKMARDYNVVRVMGSSLLAQLPDVGATVMSEGLMRTMGSLFGDFVDGFKLMRLGVKEAQRVGTADDMMMGGRMGSIADLSEQYTRQSKAEIISGAVAHKALMLFGVSPWTVMMKGRMSYLGTDSILRGIEALATGKKLSDAQRARLTANGIGPDEVKAIYAERANWQETRGFLTANVDAWKNPEAVNAMSRALLRRIDNAVITPNAADRPLWTQTEVGKALAQFQGFGWAAHQRVLLAGLQYRDWDTLMGITAMIGLGMSATAMRDIVSKGEVDKKRTTAAWI